MSSLNEQVIICSFVWALSWRSASFCVNAAFGIGASDTGSDDVARDLEQDFGGQVAEMGPAVRLSGLAHTRAALGERMQRLGAHALHEHWTGQLLHLFGFGRGSTSDGAAARLTRRLVSVGIDILVPTWGHDVLSSWNKETKLQS